jgi:hypothetical protein
METMTITLTLHEYENFRAIAERFNVKFDVKHTKELYVVKAPREKLLQWGYLEDQEPDA